MCDHLMKWTKGEQVQTGEEGREGQTQWEGAHRWWREKTEAQRKGRSEHWAFPRVINLPAGEHVLCLSAGLPAEAGTPVSLAAGGEGGLPGWLSVWGLSPPSAPSGFSGRGLGLLPGAGLQLRPEPVRNLSGARREGGFVSSKDTSKAKNYIPGRPKYACLEKLLAFMKSLVRKAGLQMTASERQ